MTLHRRAFSLIELLVVIALVAVLISLLSVAIAHSRAQARSVQCLSNLRQLSLGFKLYADAHGGRLPHDKAEPWFVAIAPILESSEAVFRCPDDPGESPVSFTWRDEEALAPAARLGGKKIDFLHEGSLVVLFDAGPSWHAPGWRNAAHLDATARSYEEDELRENLLLGVRTGEPFFLDGPGWE